MFLAYAVFTVMSPAVPAHGADPCTATLSGTLDISVPFIKIGDGHHGVSLTYRLAGPIADGCIWFEPIGVGISGLTTCSNPTALIVDSDKLIVRVPSLTAGETELWAELAYVPIEDACIWLRLSDYGIMPNRMFVTSVTGSGDLGTWPDAGGKTGLEAGDAVCNTRAGAAEIEGTFVAGTMGVRS